VRILSTVSHSGDSGSLSRQSMWDVGFLVDKVPLGQVFTSTFYPTIIIPPLKVRPRTGLEGPEGKNRYSSTLSLTSALDGE
jgi:hypothetical protein